MKWNVATRKAAEEIHRNPTFELRVTHIWIQFTHSNKNTSVAPIVRNDGLNALSYLFCWNTFFSFLSSYCVYFFFLFTPCQAISINLTKFAHSNRCGHSLRQFTILSQFLIANIVKYYVISIKSLIFSILSVWFTSSSTTNTIFNVILYVAIHY